MSQDHQTHGVTQKKQNRRQFLEQTGKIAAIGAAGLILPGCSIFGGGECDEDSSLEDSTALNAVLEIEHKLVSSYQFVIDAGVLNAASMDLAKRFRDDHRRHVTSLGNTIRGLKNRPVNPKEDYGLDTSKIPTIKSALSLFRDLEKESSLAYLNAIQTIKDPGVSANAAGLYGVETMHWSILRYWLGERPIPKSTIG